MPPASDSIVIAVPRRSWKCKSTRPALFAARSHNSAKYRFLKPCPVLVVSIIGDTRGLASRTRLKAAVHGTVINGPETPRRLLFP